MVLKNFEPAKLRAELHEMSVKHRIAFAASCCERLVPNYIGFAQTENWGDPNLIRYSLDQVWSFLRGGVITGESIRELSQRCEAVAPDTEVYSSNLTSAALDAVGAVVETLDSCLDGSVEHAVSAASLARDTIDMYIQVRDDLDYTDPEFEEKILNDQLMQEELQKQSKDIEDLKAGGPLGEDTLDRIRLSSSQAGLQHWLREIAASSDIV